MATTRGVFGDPKAQPKAIGIDEFSIRNGHTCRIVVSDLIRRPSSLADQLVCH